MKRSDRMKQDMYLIIRNKEIAPSVFEMTVEGDGTPIKRPGQFVNIKLDGFFLRRPISVCDFDEKKIKLIYKIVGGGTEKLAGMKEGERLDMLVGLGNGFDIRTSGDTPLLIGGGVGVPPLYGLFKKLVAEGKRPSVILGFNKADEIFYEKEFSALSDRVIITTVDGSRGIKGFVTAAMNDIPYSYIYTCGPKAMLSAVSAAAKTSGQFSLEERMGCGFGACMGCTCKTKSGAKRVCREGPVFVREEIEW